MKRRRRRGRPNLFRKAFIFLVFVVACGAGYWLLFGNDASRVQRIIATPVFTSQAEPAEIASVTPAAVVATPITPESTPLAPSASPSLPQTAAAGAPHRRHAELAIIIDDCGQYLAVERALVALPIPLTMSVLPEVPYTHVIAEEAHAAGKGVMLHLPMETLSGLYPGPGEITTEMADDEIELQVRRDLQDVPLATGVNNHEGSKASADDRVMRDVSQVLAQDHLFFIDSRTNVASVAQRDAHAAGIPTAARDVFLDGKQQTAYSQRMLLHAAQLALQNGSAIAIGHPHPTTLAAIRNEIPALHQMGVTLTLAQSLVQ
ncbi:MAG TPA: divergent polysaccharide deacetylase family protein [Candidatus Acidoferrales bacterium]|nr:divergent polysaccharide deacetylase family protein [Candidatus Acidoferrales bacterium]